MAHLRGPLTGHDRVVPAELLVRPAALTRGLPALVRVLVVEHRPVYRAGVRAAMESEPGMVVVAEVAAPGEVLAAVARHRPEVVVLGHDTGGPSTCRAIVDRFPRVRTVILGPPDADGAVVGAVRAGARGYVPVTAGRSAYVAAVRAVARGRSAFDRDGTAAVERALAAQRVRDDRLTPRELEVLRLADGGLSTSEIAAHLALSGTTVKSYLSSLMRKLGVNRRAGAVYVGRERGLI